MLTKIQQYLAGDIFSAGAVLFDTNVGFELKLHEDHPTWPKSPIYLNLRTEQHPVPAKRGKLTAKHMEWIGLEFYDLLVANTDVEFDCFADIPEAGTPFGNQIAKWFGAGKTRLKLIKTVGPDGKRHINAVESPHPTRRHRKVLLIDDLISEATTKFEAIRLLEAAGYEVVGIIVLVDRCQGGVEELEKAGYKVLSVMRLPDMLEYYVRKEYITNEVKVLVLNYPHLISELKAAL